MNIKKDKKAFIKELNSIKKYLPKQYVMAIKMKFNCEIHEDRVRNIKNHGSPVDWEILEKLKSICLTPTLSTNN